mgnify:CR=1 FL=1
MKKKKWMQRQKKLFRVQNLPCTAGKTTPGVNSKKMNWVKKTGSYLLEGILDTDSENENSVLWRQRIQLVMQEAGSRNFH